VTFHAYGMDINVALQLRDIEIIVQQQLEVLEAEGKDDDTLKDVQKILYSTEVGDLVRCFVDLRETDMGRLTQDGFEVPEGGAIVDEEETF
jgi:RP/EB family microtubule-associated protein